MPEKKKMISTAEVARIVGRSSRTIQDLAKQGYLTSLKKDNRYTFDLYTVIQEYIEYSSGKDKASSSSELTLEKIREDVRFRRAKADIMELNLAELEGRMHAAEDVEAMTTDLVLSVRSALLAVPERLGVELAEISDINECTVKIREVVYEVLQDLSRYEYNPEEYRKRVRERQGWKEEYEEEDED